MDRDGPLRFCTPSPRHYILCTGEADLVPDLVQYMQTEFPRLAGRLALGNGGARLRYGAIDSATLSSIQRVSMVRKQQDTETSQCDAESWVGMALRLARRGLELLIADREENSQPASRGSRRSPAVGARLSARGSPARAAFDRWRARGSARRVVDGDSSTIRLGAHAAPGGASRPVREGRGRARL